MELNNMEIYLEQERTNGTISIISVKDGMKQVIGIIHSIDNSFSFVINHHVKNNDELAVMAKQYKQWVK
jgi:hypothetical protein